VFSAAIPGQGGERHIHLQFPDFWEGLFSRHGFQKLDVLRSKIVADRAIAWWYRQNMFMFASPTAKLAVGQLEFLPDDFYLIHKSIANRPRSLKILLGELGRALLSSIRLRPPAF
jgi:hypothetical protein